MTRLRTSRGINIDDLKTRFGVKYYSYFSQVLEKIYNTDDFILNGKEISLTEKGFLKSDNIFRELFYI